MTRRLYPYARNGRFYNDKFLRRDSFIGGTLPMLWQSRTRKDDKRRAPQPHIWVTHCEPVRSHVLPVITWIGHSTFLIQMAGINILTDPIFGDVSYFHRRLFAPGLPLVKLPPIDFVLISHNHPDHMEKKSLLYLKRYPQLKIIAPLGDKQWFLKHGFTQVYECNWWQELNFNAAGYYCNGDIRFTFLPAIHGSQRTLFDQNKSLWGSWMIECGPIRFYFAGDSAYSPHFTDIGNTFPPIDIAFLPIGPCEPRTWMREIYMNVQESVQAFMDLKAQHFIPMHWGTFFMGLDECERPIKLLEKEWLRRKDEQAKFNSLRVFRFGEQFEFIKTELEPEIEITVRRFQPAILKHAIRKF